LAEIALIQRIGRQWSILSRLASRNDTTSDEQLQLQLQGIDPLSLHHLPPKSLLRPD
jgi:hypothetical protein